MNDKLNGDYSFWANKYNPSSFGKSFKTVVERLYLKMLQENTGPSPLLGKSILEIGPGIGSFAQEIENTGMNYTGIERSRELVCYLREKRINVIEGDFKEIEFAEKFDIIYASHVIEHSDTVAQAKEFCAAAYKNLMPGGFLMLNFPNYLHHGKYFYLHDYTHNFVTTRLRINNLLIDCGFVTVYCCETLLFYRNPVIVFLLKIISDLIPACFFDFIGTWVLKGFVGTCKIYGKSNISLIAQKPIT